MNPEHMPDEQYRILLDELGRYQPRLVARPRVVALSKADTVDAETVELVATSLALGAGRELHAVSAASHQGLTPLLRSCADSVESAIGGDTDDRIRGAPAAEPRLHRVP